MNTYSDYKKILYKNIDDNIDDAIELNEWMAAHPELSGEEFESSKKIVKYLRKNGWKVEYPFAGLPTSFNAVYGDSSHSRKVAIMVEYDALPEIGHGCGHCLSGSASILAGVSLKDLQDDLDVDIHIMGTPVEETDGAKAIMAKDGVFDDYSMAIMIHMYDSNIMNPVALALDTNLYTFHGKSAHASSAPWDGINAFNGVQLMMHGIDMMRQHVKSDVRMHGIIRYPGEAPNIVPELCSVEVYTRALERSYLNEITKRVDNCAEGAAIATGTTWEKESTSNSYDNLRYNEAGLKALEEAYAEVGLYPNGAEDDLFGSTDAGNVSYICPVFQGTIQLVDKEIAIHSKEFADNVVGENANKILEKSAKIIGLQIIKIFSDRERYDAMIADFERS